MNDDAKLLIALREQTEWRGRAAPLTQEGKVIAAMMLNPENPDVALIDAIIAVEAAGKPFLKDGRPTIRFETHVFSRYTAHMYDATHPHLSTPDFDVNHSWSKERAYDQFNEAFDLNPVAAVMSTSWGAPQIMGFNWQDSYYNSIADFVYGMMTSANEGLFAMIRLCRKWGIDTDLIRHRWKEFSGRYNGDKTGVYARRLARAYNRAANKPGQLTPAEAKAIYSDLSPIVLGSDVPSAPPIDEPEIVQSQPETVVVERKKPWWKKLLELFS